jgi:hypothetical protein
MPPIEVALVLREVFHTGDTVDSPRRTALLPGLLPDRRLDHDGIWGRIRSPLQRRTQAGGDWPVFDRKQTPRLLALMRSLPDDAQAGTFRFA